METIFEALIDLLQKIINQREEDVHQKWINLAMLKCNLRRALAEFEASLESRVQGLDRRVVMGEFFSLKDILWQAVGAVHGNLSAMTIALEVRSVLSSLNCVI